MSFRTSFALALVLVACGGTVNGTGAAGGSGGSAGGSGGSGGSGVLPTGDCATDADCPMGSECVPVVPGGFLVCTWFPDEATTCQDPMVDDCCSTAECAAGACYFNFDFPYCGGPAIQQQNVCLADQCQTDADCAQPGSPNLSALCITAGTMGYAVKACVLAGCATNADCTAKGAGYCAPIASPCCNTWTGLGCVYAGGCRQDSDCTVGYCDFDYDSGEGACKDDGGPTCPL